MLCLLQLSLCSRKIRPRHVIRYTYVQFTWQKTREIQQYRLDR